MFYKLHKKQIMSCSSTFTTSLGEITVVNQIKTYHEAYVYCADHGGIIAPTNTQTVVDEVSDHLRRCPELTSGNSVFVGLRLANDVGYWSDGRKYDPATEGSLFGYDSPSRCNQAKITYNHDILWLESCTDSEAYSNFLCLNTGPDYTWLYVALPILLVFMLLLFLFCYAKKKGYACFLSCTISKKIESDLVGIDSSEDNFGLKTIVSK